MSINKETVKKISKLARISVSDQQASMLEKNLNSILSFVNQLKRIKHRKNSTNFNDFKPKINYERRRSKSIKPKRRYFKKCSRKK